MKTLKQTKGLTLAVGLAGALLGMLFIGVAGLQARADSVDAPPAGAGLWQAIENAYHVGDRERLAALGANVPVERQADFGRILAEFDGERMRAPRALGEAVAPNVGINGAPCSYATIGAAIAAASDGDTIYIPSGNVYSELLGSISDDLTFVASLADCSGPDPAATSSSVTIDGGGASGGAWGGIADILPNTVVTFTHIRLYNAAAFYGGILYVDQGATVILDESEVEEGSAANFGGGVRVYIGGRLLANGSYIHRNRVTGTLSGGGGVAIYQGAMTATAGSNVGLGNGGNTSADQGGGVYLESSTLYLDDSHVVANDAADEGGGVYAFGASVVDLNGFARIGGFFDVFSNTAQSGGGAYLLGNSGLVLRDASGVIKNHAFGDGGGVHAAQGAYVTLRDGSAEVLSNTCGANGGGVYLTDDGTRLNMIYGGGWIEGNHAAGAVSGGGGGVYVTEAAAVYAEDSTFQGNTTDEYGGGIHVAQDAAVTPTNVILNGGNSVVGNQAVLGGGFYIQDDGSQVVISGSQIEDNEASITGGGIRLFGDADLQLIGGSTLIRNTADSDGGGLAMYTGTVTMDDVTVHYNEALGGDGGGVMQTQGILTASDPDIRFNTAHGDGGGIYRVGGALVLAAATKQSYLAVNDATRGGGLYDVSGETVEIRALAGSGFSLNTNGASDDGGAVYLSGGTGLNIYGDVTVSTNEATSDGGAFYVDGGSLVLDGGAAIGEPDLGGANAAINGSGGVIHATGGATIVLDNVSLGTVGAANSAGMDGGGLYADGSTVLLEDVRVFGNAAGDDGGGIAAVNGSTLVMQTSYADATPECDPNTLAPNVYCSEVSDNEAQGWGAGIYLDRSTALIEDTAFLDNVGLGTSPGAAMMVGRDATAELTNVLVSGHGANENSAIHVYSGGALTSLHATYGGNLDTPLYVVSTAAVTLTNNIIWDNGASAFFQPGAGVTSACNDTQTLLGGTGDISADPLFVTTARGNYRLGGNGSPAVDACAGTLALDLDARARPIDADGVASASEFDMGAFESPFKEFVFLPLTLRNW